MTVSHPQACSEHSQAETAGDIHLLSCVKKKGFTYPLHSSFFTTIGRNLNFKEIIK